MMTGEEMKKCGGCDVSRCDKNGLADIRNIEICGDTATARALDFIGKIKNPYMCAVGDVVVKVNYSGDGKFAKKLSDAFCMM